MIDNYARNHHVEGMEPSTQKITLSIAMPQTLRERIEREAARLDRSRSWLVVRAIETYLSRDEKDAAP